MSIEGGSMSSGGVDCLGQGADSGFGEVGGDVEGLDQ